MKPPKPLADQNREALWVDRFAMRLSELGSRADPEMLVEMGRELYDTQGDNDPVGIAEAEWNSWPPHDD